LVATRGVWSYQRTPKDKAFIETRAVLNALNVMSMESREDVLACLNNMTYVRVDLAGGPRQAALKGFLADAIYYYYINDDPDVYKAWMRRRGLGLRDESVVDRREPALTELREVLHRFAVDPSDVPSAADDVATLFDINWRIRRRIGDGANVASGLSSDATGLVTVFAVADQDHRSWPSLEDGIGTRAWHGASAMSARRWFRGGPAFSTLCSRGPMLIAQTGIVMEFGDGIRRPVLFSTFWDERADSWLLENVAQTNVPETHLTWPWDL
jgi:hypothetical protein